MHPAALNLGPGVDQFRGSFQAGRAIHDNELKVFPLQAAVVEILKETFPGVPGFSLGLFEVDHFTFAKEREAVSGEDLALMVLALVTDLESNGIEKRPAVIGRAT